MTATSELENGQQIRFGPGGKPGTVLIRLMDKDGKEISKVIEDTEGFQRAMSIIGNISR